KKYGTPLKILRDKKLREQRARILEKAAATLIELPLYGPTVGDMLGGPSIPETLKATADLIRKGKFPGGNRRPRAIVAKMIASDLANQFEEITGYPLYEYVGKLIVTVFPEEWSQPSDIREAVRKLVKADYAGRKSRANETRRVSPNAKRGQGRLSKLTASEIERNRQQWKERQERIKS